MPQDLRSLGFETGMTSPPFGWKWVEGGGGPFVVSLQCHEPARGYSSCTVLEVLMSDGSSLNVFLHQCSMASVCYGLSVCHLEK